MEAKQHMEGQRKVKKIKGVRAKETRRRIQDKTGENDGLKAKENKGRKCEAFQSLKGNSLSLSYWVLYIR